MSPATTNLKGVQHSFFLESRSLMNPGKGLKDESCSAQHCDPLDRQPP